MAEAVADRHFLRGSGGAGVPRLHGSHVHAGFTLVEMMVALAILMILLLALVGSFATNVAGFKRTQLLTMAQNLAELQVEDLKSMAPSVLRLLVDGKYLGSETPLTPIEKNSPLFRFSNYPTDTDVAPSASADWRYDSGPQQTDFNIWGLTSIQSSSGSFTAGPGTTSQPATPSSGDVLLGGTMTIQPYQVLDATTGTNVGWYYRLVLHKEQFPLFEKRIEVTMFSASGLPAHTYGPVIGDQDAMFDYTVTVLMKRGSTFQTLYTSGGTISSPYARDPFILSVVSPNGGESLTANGTFVVTWNASGDLTSVNDYRVYFSFDDGLTWSLLGTAGSGATSLSLPVPAVNSTKCKIQVVARFGSGTTAASDVSNSVFGVH